MTSSMLTGSRSNEQFRFEPNWQKRYLLTLRGPNDASMLFGYVPDYGHYVSVRTAAEGVIKSLQTRVSTKWSFVLLWNHRGMAVIRSFDRGSYLRKWHSRLLYVFMNRELWRRIWTGVIHMRTEHLICTMLVMTINDCGNY